jgi:hypothetical protein
MTNYFKHGEKTNFKTLVKAASLRNESAIGYRMHAEYDNKLDNYGVNLNPNKNIEIQVGEKDELIVLARKKYE